LDKEGIRFIGETLEGLSYSAATQAINKLKLQGESAAL
jgi:hypothetical protein